VRGGSKRVSPAAKRRVRTQAEPKELKRTGRAGERPDRAQKRRTTTTTTTTTTTKKGRRVRRSEERRSR
jgi:hypothetical protein